MKRKVLKKVDVALLVILLIGAVVRFWGISYGLPHIAASPDEADVVNAALRFGTGELNPGRFIYPTFYEYLLFVVYGLYFFLGRAVGTFSSLEEFAFLSMFHPSELFLINRVFVALIGVGTIFVIYKIAGLIFGKRSGILAAFLLSLTYLHVRESHFGKLDVPMVFLIMASVYYIFKCYKEKKLKDYLIAGFIAGLAVSTKYAGVLLIFPMTAVYVFDKFSKKRKGFIRLFFGKQLMGFGAMMVLGFFLGTPFALVEVKQFIADLSEQTSWVAIGNAIKVAPAWWYYLRYSLFYGMGWPLLLCSIAGMVWFFKKDYKQASVLFLFPAVYYFIVGRGGYTFSRYILPVVPFLVIAAGGLLSAIHDWSKSYIPKKIADRAIFLLLIFILAPSFFQILVYNRLVSKKDSRVIASEWMDNNFPKGGSVYQTGSVWGKLQLRPSLASLERRLEEFKVLQETGANDWERRSMSLLLSDYEDKGIVGFEDWVFEEEMGEFFYEGRAVEGMPEFIVVETSPLKYFSKKPIGIVGILDEHYSRVASFEVVEVENENNFFEQQDAFYVPYSGFGGVERPGPNIYIYERLEEL